MCYISVILYLFAEGYKGRLTTFLPVLLVMSLCAILTALFLCEWLLYPEQMNKYHIMSIKSTNVSIHINRAKKGLGKTHTTQRVAVSGWAGKGEAKAPTFQQIPNVRCDIWCTPSWQLKLSHTWVRNSTINVKKLYSDQHFASGPNTPYWGFVPGLYWVTSVPQSPYLPPLPFEKFMDLPPPCTPVEWNELDLQI